MPIFFYINTRKQYTIFVLIIAPISKGYPSQLCLNFINHVKKGYNSTEIIRMITKIKLDLFTVTIHYSTNFECNYCIPSKVIEDKQYIYLVFCRILPQKQKKKKKKKKKKKLSRKRAITWPNVFERISISNLTCILQCITKTRLYNFDPLKPHFYIVKLGFTGVYIFFSYFAKNIDYECSLEPPRRGGSNEYTRSMFRAEIRRILEFFI